MSSKIFEIRPVITRISAAISLVILLACTGAYGAESEDQQNGRRSFSEFAVELPEGWDGEEQKGFISDDPAEYLLTLGRKDDKGDNFIAQISIFLLPNKPRTNPEEAAHRLAEAQGDSSEPVHEGNFWVFTGEPRSNVVKGMARTMVNTSPEKMLIIIAQDPQGLGADAIVNSLKGLTDVSRALLGR